MESTIIRQSRIKLFGMFLLSGTFILYYCFGPYEKTRIMYNKSPKFTILLSIIIISILFYSIIELFLKKGEIILTEEGIEIRGNEWNHWDYVNSFWIAHERDVENPDKEYLVVQLKDMRQIKCLISDLDKSSNEIIQLLKMYKRQSQTT